MKYLAVIFFSIITFCVMGQHMPINTQYMYQVLLVNPALTGSRNNLIVSATHRNQWLGNKSTPRTNIVTAHSPLKKEDLALGAQVYQQSFNGLNNIGISGYGSYRIRLDAQKVLSFGLKLGLLSSTYDWSSIETITPNDPNFEDLNQSFSPLIGFGTFFKTKKLYLGLAVPEMVNNNSDESIDFRNWNTIILAGYIFDLNKKYSVIPNLLIRKIGNSKAQSDLTVLFRINKKVDLGLILRSGFKIIGASFDIYLTKQIQLGYTFDTGIRKNNPLNTYGNHELSLSYEFKKIVRSSNSKIF